MSALNLNPNDPYSLLRIGEAWRNRPGVTTLLITFVAVALLGALGAASGSFGMIPVLGVIAVIVWLLGLTAAGGQFMDQAGDRPVATVMHAFIGSPMVVLRMIGLGIILFFAFLAFLLVAVVLLFLCKVPTLGPVLYVVALPTLTFVGALVFLGLYVTAALAAPALWEGHSLTGALSHLWAVATQRPMQALLNLMLLFLVSGIIIFVASGFVFAGFGATTALSASILGGEISSGISSAFGSFTGGGRGYGGSSGLVTAGLVGGALVFAVTGAFFTAMFLLGLALTYLKVTAGVDVTAAQTAMDAAIAKTKQKAHQAADEAKRRAQEAQLVAQQRLEQARAAQALRSTAPVATLACPNCKATVIADEAFCGNCGHSLHA